MAQLKIRKVTALPATLEPSCLYIISTADPSIMDMYVSSSDGTTSRHIVNKSEIQDMINASLASFSSLDVYADIAARDAVATPTVPTHAIVLDASADATVTSGAATYIYDPSTTQWYKISEAESMDVVLQWASIVGAPTSPISAIDDAVVKRHEHTNKTLLDSLSDVGGDLHYLGAPIRAFLDEEAW